MQDFYAKSQRVILFILKNLWARIYSLRQIKEHEVCSAGKALAAVCMFVRCIHVCTCDPVHTVCVYNVSMCDTVRVSAVGAV